MEIQVLTEFQLQITQIGEDIAKKVILPQIWPIFRPSLVKIVSKIAKFERISNFYDLKNMEIQVLTKFLHNFIS